MKHYCVTAWPISCSGTKHIPYKVKEHSISWNYCTMEAYNTQGDWDIYAVLHYEIVWSVIPTLQTRSYTYLLSPQTVLLSTKFWRGWNLIKRTRVAWDSTEKLSKSLPLKIKLKCRVTHTHTRTAFKIVCICVDAYTQTYTRQAANVPKTEQSHTATAK